MSVDVCTWFSEVHSAATTSDNHNVDKCGYVHSVTRFHFSYKDEDSGAELEEDDDGDLVVCRRESFSISIEHTFGTAIEHVGLQIWPGCLLLCDYIIAHREIFTGKTVVELGGGIGLASMVCSLIGAKAVTCTDAGDEILALCEGNVKQNECNVKVKELDWFCPSDLSEIEHADFLIASDVIYDNELTEVFFNLVHTLMRCSPKVLLLTLEQRINFLTDGLRCACPAHEYFVEAIEELKERGRKEGILYKVQQMDVTFEESTEYERSPLCEIWRITSAKVD